MSQTDVIIQGYLFKYGTPLFYVLIILMCMSNYLKGVQNKLFSKYIVRCDEVYERTIEGHKKKLFSRLQSMVSADWRLKNQGLIRILEIGVRTGQNIKYYPKNSHVIVIDRNNNLKDHFKSIDQTKVNSITVEQYITSYGDNLDEVADASIDAVVATLVLCSVPDVRHMLNEIWRILAPGGTYFFLEHIHELDDPSLRRIQTILTSTGIWPFLFDGCHLDRNIEQSIKKRKFKEVQCEHLKLELKGVYPLKYTKTHIIGTAIK